MARPRGPTPKKKVARKPNKRCSRKLGYRLSINTKVIQRNLKLYNRLNRSNISESSSQISSLTGQIDDFYTSSDGSTKQLGSPQCKSTPIENSEWKSTPMPSFRNPAKSISALVKQKLHIRIHSNDEDRRSEIIRDQYDDST